MEAPQPIMLSHSAHHLSMPSPQVFTFGQAPSSGNKSSIPSSSGDYKSSIPSSQVFTFG